MRIEIRNAGLDVHVVLVEDANVIIRYITRKEKMQEGINRVREEATNLGYKNLIIRDLSDPS